MATEYYQRIAAYRLAMSIAANMRLEGIISQQDYERVEALLSAKYGLFCRSIYR